MSREHNLYSHFDHRMVLDQTRAPLVTALHSSANWSHASFYTPGHKQGRGAADVLVELLGSTAVQADIPEIPGLDNFFAPKSVIAEALELAAAAFGAERTWFLINGSTCGVEAAILATCQPGDKIIVPRNAHRSVISGLILSGAIPVFVAPDYDTNLELAHGLTVAGVAQALQEHPDAKAVLIVSPTYYGVCSDVAAIATLTHDHNMPLIVDEAHGPHFAFHPDLPTPALALGADLVIQSTHKVLSSLTQSAMLHVQGDRIDRDRMSQAWALVQSTSPSYLLLASLDAARQQMATVGRDLLERTLDLSRQARQQLQEISGISVISPAQIQAGTEPYALDLTRITVDLRQLGITGFAADEFFCDRAQVVAELPGLHHMTFIVSIGNTAADIDRLVSGFEQLSQAVQQGEIPADAGAIATPDPLTQCVSTVPVSPRQAFFSPAVKLSPSDAIGQISAETICPYPPGIPTLLPGEQISAAAIAQLQQVLAAGGIITGCSDPALQTLKVVKNPDVNPTQSKI